MKKCAWLVCHLIDIMQRSSISVRGIQEMFFFILLQKVQNEQQLLEKGNEEGKRKNTKKKQKPKLYLSNGQSVSQSVNYYLGNRWTSPSEFGVTPASST